MACPLCRGASRAPIAPGYWECQSIVTVPRIHQVPDQRILGGFLQQVVQESSRCGHRYAESVGLPAPGAVCGCGTFAIGLCADCSTPVCGDHSGVWGGNRLCHGHYQASVAEEEASRLTMPAFLSLVAEFGWPGLRTWVIQDMKVGGTRDLAGWLVPFPGKPEGAVVLGDDGSLNILDRLTHKMGTWADRATVSRTRSRSRLIAA